MDDAVRRKVEANLFRAARRAVEPWDKFPWHADRNNVCDTWKPHSSQALAIDVFGTLKMLEQSQRDAIFDALCRKLSIPVGGPWQVHLEWSDPQNLLKEPRPTQVDAVVEGRQSFILFEVKFTERQAGCCSQPPKQCDGNYRWQTNPDNQVKARCALSGKGVRYWEFIPQIFRLSSDADHTPCPFASEEYQWMRNLVLSRAIAQARNIHTAFAIAYVDHPALHIPGYFQGRAWAEFVRLLRPDAPPLGLMELRQFTRDSNLSELNAWIETKLKKVEDEPGTVGGPNRRSGCAKIVQ